jgi:hypothetical protein
MRRQRCGGGRECRGKKNGVISCERSVLCGRGATLQRKARGVAAHVNVEAIVKELKAEGCLEKGLQSQMLFGGTTASYLLQRGGNDCSKFVSTVTIQV